MKDKKINKAQNHMEHDIGDGVYAIPRNPNEPRVKIRALYAYCEKNRINPSQLNEEEMKQFLVDPKEC